MIKSSDVFQMFGPWEKGRRQIGRKPQFHSSNAGWTTFDSLVALIWPLKRGNGCYKRQKSPGKTHTHTHTLLMVKDRYQFSQDMTGGM